MDDTWDHRISSGRDMPFGLLLDYHGPACSGSGPFDGPYSGKGFPSKPLSIDNFPHSPAH
jgi:hypothetical protein